MKSAVLEKRPWSLVIALACVLSAGAIVGVAALSAEVPAQTLDQVVQGNGEALDCHHASCDDVALGRKAFRTRRFRDLGGNGRSCADCHMPEGGTFQLTPDQARTRFETLMARREHHPRADDPLFRAIDADDFRVNGEAASDFSNLTQLGLIRITLPLPANVTLIDPITNQPSSEQIADVWRAVPSLMNVRITGPDGLRPFASDGPNLTGGYQWDGRFETLQEQALQAMIAHAQIDSLPSPQLLDRLAAFQETLFSSRRVRSLANAMQTGLPLPDPDPKLTPIEQEGKAVFTRACAQCHGNDRDHPSQSTPLDQAFSTTTPPAILRYHTIRSTCPRPAGFGFTQCSPQMMKNVRTYEIRAGSAATRVTLSDPGRGLLTGNAADFGLFDVPQLRGISRTAPYFHNNSAATLEDVLDHYDAFFRLVIQNNPKAPILTTDGIHIDRPPTAAERQALLAYLRKL